MELKFYKIDIAALEIDENSRAFQRFVKLS